ncbi:Type I Iterative PKS [Exophiala oligosperma]
MTGSTVPRFPSPNSGTSNMPIAVVGIGARFSDTATDPEKFWELLAEGRSTSQPVPKDRFDADAYYHPDYDHAGTCVTTKGHFMKQDVSKFDAPFFSITANEAKSMDPQQRMALEVAYEAFENAGMRIEDLTGSNTSVYMGTCTQDYYDLLLKDSEPTTMHSVTGISKSLLACRLSWFFDLRGPALTIDTACSSALCGVHLACQSLRTGESETALVAGTNLIFAIDTMVSMSAIHALSPDGQCYSYDHKANGYARGDGIAALVLKPLEKALADGDVIRGVIRGSAINQDGGASGITLPIAAAQVDLVNTAYSNAGLPLNQTAYFEGHGTGTVAGDLQETTAMAKTIGKVRSKESPLYIGSSKTNIGHIEGASGLAGLIKVIFSLEHGMIAPNVKFEHPPPSMDFDEWNLKVATELTPWPLEGVRRASVNGFGFGGTNAHVIVDDAYHFLKEHGLKGRHNCIVNEPSSSPHSTADSGFGTMDSSVELSDPFEISFKNKIAALNAQPRLLPWSSGEKKGLERTFSQLSEYLTQKAAEGYAPEVLDRLGFTLAKRRSIFPWRTFSMASSLEGAATQLSASLATPVRAKQSTDIAFIFTGQGAQWHAMGRELLPYRVFHDSLTASDEVLQALGCTWSLFKELAKDKDMSRIDETELSQACCTALQLALVDLLRSWDVLPNAVIGHSSGEIAAACAKGAISRAYAIKAAYYRGVYANKLKEVSPDLKLGMLAVGVGEAQMRPYLEPVQDKVTIACYNSPSSLTLSGEVSSLDEVEEALKAESIFARKLKVNVAYHSTYLKGIAEEYSNSLGDEKPLSNCDSIKMISTVTGLPIESSSFETSYWVSNLLSPVKFDQGLQKLLKDTSIDLLVEIGPHGALQGPVKQILSAINMDLPSMSLLDRKRDAASSTVEAMGRLWQYGVDVDVPSVNSLQGTQAGTPTPLVDLPPYAWNHENNYWCESTISKDVRFRHEKRHHILGYLIPGAVPNEPLWRNLLRISESPWLQHHKIQGTILYPAAGFIATGIQAMWEFTGFREDIAGFELRDVKIERGLVVPADDAGVETSLQLKPIKVGTASMEVVWHEFTLYSRSSSDIWQEHCSGLIRIKPKQQTNALFKDEEAAEMKRMRERHMEIRSRCTKSEYPRQFYEALSTMGYQYGSVFRGLSEIKYGYMESSCVCTVPDTRATMPFNFELPHIVHPAFLDSIFHMLLPSLMPEGMHMSAVGVPTHFEYLYVAADISKTPGDDVIGYSEAIPPLSRETHGNLVVMDAGLTKPVVVIENLTCTAVASAGNEQDGLRQLGSELIWKTDVNELGSTMAPAELDTITTRLLAENPKVAEELEFAGLTYAKRILNSITPEQVKSLKPHHQLFYQYCQHNFELASQGKLPHQTSGLDWLNPPEEVEKDILSRVSQATNDGRLLCHQGEHLIDILLGKTEPLEVMMEDNLLDAYHGHHLGWEIAHHQLAEYIDLLAHKNPELNVLEIGAGTGGTTLPILQKLGGEKGESPRMRSYCYTDITSGFFEAAAEKFAPWVSYMQFQKLDVESDPTEQGYEAGSYDVIIASNVLHATRSMDETISNVSTLLKPGGKLVLYEITNPLQRVCMIFGSLPGWFAGADEGRRLSPCLTEKQWSDLLQRHNFSGVDVSARSMPSEQDYMQSFMASTKNAAEIKTQLPTDVVIIQPGDAEVNNKLNEKLVSALQAVGVQAACQSMAEALAAGVNKKFCIITLEAEKPWLIDVDAKDFDNLQDLVVRSRRLLWLTRGATDGHEPGSSLITGLARAIRAENPGLVLATLDLDPSWNCDDRANIDSIMRVFELCCEEKEEADPDWEYALRRGSLQIPRYTPDAPTDAMLQAMTTQRQPVAGPLKQDGRPLKLEIGAPGMLSSFRFVSDEKVVEPLADNEIEIEVKATGLTPRDVLIATGQAPLDEIGSEAAGVVCKVGNAVNNFKLGDRVVTWQRNEGCLRTHLRSTETSTLAIPDNLSFEDAASLPMAFATAWYALSLRVRLGKDQSVLIHNGASAVGQASIMVAQHLGGEVFVSVSTAEEKAVVQKYGVKNDNILSVTDAEFVRGIKRLTNGKGVDVVLNSLRGEALRQTWHCVAPFGYFIELGQEDILGNTGLDMGPFKHNVTFIGVNLLELCRSGEQIAATLFGAVWELLKDGKIQPPQGLSQYKYSQMEGAFNAMQSTGIGKVIMTVEDGDEVLIVPPGAQALDFNPDASYILAGGSGGIGPLIAAWMADHGAKNLIVLSRSGIMRPDAKEVYDALVVRGLVVKDIRCDVTDPVAVSAAVDECQKTMPVIKGIIMGAVKLEDSVFDNMTFANWKNCLDPKVKGTWNLHQALPKDLDFFVCLSSIGGSVGNRGQGNHAAESTYQDALMEHRRNLGLAGCSIDIGTILGVGWIAENIEAAAMAYLRSIQYLGMRFDELLLLIQAAITGYTMEGYHTPTVLAAGLGTGGLVLQHDVDPPFWFDDAKFRHLRIVGTHSNDSSDDQEGGSVPVSAQLKAATSLNEAGELVTAAITNRLAKQLLMSPDDLDSMKPISRLGVDSLIAVELRNWIFREVGADVGMFEILSEEPMCNLAVKIAGMSKFLPKSLTEGGEEEAKDNAFEQKGAITNSHFPDLSQGVVI